VLGVAVELLSPKVDETFYRQTSGRSEFKHDEKLPPVSEAMRKLFEAGRTQVAAQTKSEAEQKRRRVTIKYWAPQIIGENEHGRKFIRSGAKLIGVLKNPIDTRAQSLVRVLVPKGGEAGGVEIEAGSVLVGQFNYQGEGDRVFITFSRLDPPDGAEPKKVSAVGLDAANFTAGIQGEEFTGQGMKVAASVGLSMFSGITNTLTERESLGNSLSGPTAKPTMKNALLQGLSKAAQDQTGRTASGIEQERSYVLVPEGKEIIIELIEDYK